MNNQRPGSAMNDWNTPRPQGGGGQQPMQGQRPMMGGRTNPNAPAMQGNTMQGGQPMQPQQPMQRTPLTMLSGMLSNFGAGRNQSNLYAPAGASQQPTQISPGMDATINGTEEQQRFDAHCLQNTSVVVGNLLQVFARRSTQTDGGMAFKRAIDLFGVSKSGAGINTVNHSYIDEFKGVVQGTQNTYFSFVGRACTLIAIRLYVYKREHQGMDPDNNTMGALIIRATTDAMAFDFLAWLEQSKKAMYVVEQLDHELRNQIRELPNVWDIYISNGGAFLQANNGDMPWRRDPITEYMNNNTAPNPMFENLLFDGMSDNVKARLQGLNPSDLCFGQGNPMDAALWEQMTGTPYHDHLPVQFQHYTPPSAEQRARAAAQQPQQTQQPQQQQRAWPPAPTPSDPDEYMPYSAVLMYDTPKPTESQQPEAPQQQAEPAPQQSVQTKRAFSEYTYETRNEFRMEDYFIVLKDGWMSGQVEDVMHLLGTTPSNETNGTIPTPDMFESANGAMFTAFRLDEKGYTNWRRVVPTMFSTADVHRMVLTDPEKYLPELWEKDGVTHSSFEARMETVVQRLRDGVVIPMGEMKPLEEEPNMMASDAPMFDHDLNNVCKRIEVVTNAVDPESKLDAFVAPVVMNDQFVLEDDCPAQEVYEKFGAIIKGSDISRFESSVDFLNEIALAVADCNDSTFASVVRDNVTNVINRWLVEERGYSAVPVPEGSGRSHLVLADYINDSQKLADMMKNDPDTGRALLQLDRNGFLVNNIQNLLPLAEAKKHFARGKDMDNFESVLEVENALKTTIVFSRDYVMVKMDNDIGPRINGVVVSKVSEDPRFHEIIKTAIEQGKKHFKTVPVIVVHYGNPKDCAPRVVTASAFDQSVMRTRAMLGGHFSFCNVAS
ncbi:hypothetical protein PQC07_gp170 [Aeromonas phage D3]|uniref:Uncharacterized protein n=1 Tax=Aeromonas phage D3 TaxID=2593327 RepID=A0A514TVT4_9CAUD|nr:hypothetical protein PQC07_gp170 [Aeromonas phage D3]QDJ97103.1 hypothetical protein D3_0105 [Aeromonas phage D3]